MSLTLTISPLARKDILEIANYIAIDNIDAAIGFIDVTEDTCRQLSEMPELGALCQFKNPLVADVRVWSVPGYPNFLIFYRIQRKRLEIIRVLHGARDYEQLFEE